MARIIPTDAAWKDCPRADECCVNDCPLTIARHKSYSCDPQSKCSFGKTGRKRIGAKWNLKNLGLTGRELAGKLKWDNLPEEEKKSRIAGLSDKSPIVRLSEKGYAIVPKKKVISETHGQEGQVGLRVAVENDFVDDMEVKR